MPTLSLPTPVGPPAASSTGNSIDIVSAHRDADSDSPSFRSVLSAQVPVTSTGDEGAAASPATPNRQSPAAESLPADAASLLALIVTQLAGSAIAVGESGTVQCAPRSAPVSDAPITKGSTPQGARLDPELIDLNRIDPEMVDQAHARGADSCPAAVQGKAQTAFLAVADATLAAEPASVVPAATSESSGIGHSAALPHRAGAGDFQPQLHLESAVASPRWGEDLAQKVVWLANRSESRAELVLNPPQMGRIEVSLSVSGNGEANVAFASPSAQVRDALEQSLTRLREVFAAAGIALGQASVNADSPPRDEGGHRRSAAHESGAPASSVSAPPAANTWLRQGNGLVDTFA